jgi:cytochrome c oxidase subunit 3
MPAATPDVSTAGGPAGVAGQFAGRSPQRQAALLGMWTFLATEVLFFGAMFGAYSLYRFFHAQAFAEAGARMSRPWGAFNTGLLLASSAAMALGVAAARRGAAKTAAFRLALTGLLGAGFLAVKAHEWILHGREGLFPLPGLPFHFPGPHPAEARLFFNLYYVMTGLHALHLAIGIGLVWVMAALCLGGRYRAGDVTPVELSGLYWHFVDVVWVFLFPLFYLVR